MRKQAIDVRLNSPQKSVIKNWNGTVVVMLQNGDAISAERCMQSSAGQGFDLRRMNIAKTGATLDDKGTLQVDQMQNTTVSGIYALGQVANQSSLSPVTARAGMILAERIFNGRADLKIDYSTIAQIIFTNPPIGTCGLTAQEAITKFGSSKVKVFTKSFTNHFYIPVEPETTQQKSVFKIVC